MKATDESKQQEQACPQDEMHNKLAEAFAAAGPEGMASFLEELFIAEPQFGRRFVARFGQMGAAEAKESLAADLEDIQNRFENRRDGFIAWDNVNKFEHEYINAVDAHLNPLVKKRDTESIFAAIDAVLDNFRDLCFDDSYGFSTSLLDRCCEYWSIAFIFLDQDQVKEKFRYLQAVEAAIRDDEYERDNDWEIEECIEEFLINQFADDYDNAYLVREIAEPKLAACAEEAAEERKNRNAAERGFHGGRIRRGSAEREETRWALVLMRVDRAEGCSLDDLLVKAEPHLYDSDVTLFIADEAEQEDPIRAVDFLEERRAAMNEWEYRTKAEIEDRLLSLYEQAGRQDDERHLIEEMLCSLDASERRTVDLFREYKGLCDDRDWSTTRNLLLKNMMSSYKRCECLMDEGMHNELAQEVEKDNLADIHAYEDYLVNTGHADTIARHWCNAGTEQLRRAGDRDGYRRGAEMLARSAALSPNSELARSAALRIRVEYPRRTALHDELRKAGL